MKKLIAIAIIAFGAAFTAQAQNAQTETPQMISLEQTEGEFTKKQLTVSPGTYVFEITNKYAGTDVGFVLVPKGKDISNPENHIKTAYVTTVVKEGKTETSNVTTLEKGAYVYFCPLNKTATDNTLMVE